MPILIILVSHSIIPPSLRRIALLRPVVPIVVVPVVSHSVIAHWPVLHVHSVIGSSSVDVHILSAPLALSSSFDRSHVEVIVAPGSGIRHVRRHLPWVSARIVASVVNWHVVLHTTTFTHHRSRVHVLAGHAASHPVSVAAVFLLGRFVIPYSGLVHLLFAGLQVVAFPNVFTITRLLLFVLIGIFGLRLSLVFFALFSFHGKIVEFAFASALFFSLGFAEVLRLGLLVVGIGGPGLSLLVLRHWLLVARIGLVERLFRKQSVHSRHSPLSFHLLTEFLFSRRDYSGVNLVQLVQVTNSSLDKFNQDVCFHDGVAGCADFKRLVARLVQDSESVTQVVFDLAFCRNSDFVFRGGLRVFG